MEEYLQNVVLEDFYSKYFTNTHTRFFNVHVCKIGPVSKQIRHWVKKINKKCVIQKVLACYKYAFNNLFPLFCFMHF